MALSTPTILYGVLLSVIAITYTVDQLLSVNLDLYTECTPMTRQQIWQHSYDTFMAEGGEDITAAAQHGINEESCITTKSMDTNTEQLWFSNRYQSRVVSIG